MPQREGSPGHIEEVPDSVRQFLQIAFQVLLFSFITHFSLHLLTMTSTMQHNDTPEEDVIAIMGMTGSGKSTFLNLIIGDNQFKVGHGLISETADIQEFQFPYQDEAGNERLLCLIDTPGFGDTSKLDSGTLGVISAGLLERPKITGIIYFHNINEPRITHLAYKAKEIFYDICGGDAMKNVILCTSQWDKLIDKTEGERRESQLLCEYWKRMTDDGARTARHNNTPESARQILELILGSNPVPLKLVTELKAKGVTLGDTSAGRLVADFNTTKAKEIVRSLDEVKKSLEVAKMRNEMLEVKKAEDEKKHAQRVSEILAQLQEARKATTDAMNEAEKHQAEWEEKEAEVKLENESKEFGAQQKAKDIAEARLKASAVRAEEERKRLEAELKKTENEMAILAKPFNTVEYAKTVGEKVLGRRLGRFVGGVWGYASKFGFGTADVVAELSGGKKLSERKQEVMERTGRAVEIGNDYLGWFGATVGLFSGSMAFIATAAGDICDTVDDPEEKRNGSTMTRTDRRFPQVLR